MVLVIPTMILVIPTMILIIAVMSLLFSKIRFQIFLYSCKLKKTGKS